MSLLTVNLETQMVAANRRLNAARHAVIDKEARLNGEIAKLNSPVMQNAAKVLGLDYKVAEAERIVSEDGAIAHLPPAAIKG